MYVPHVMCTRSVQSWRGTCSAMLLYSRTLERNKGMLLLVWRVVYDAGSRAAWASGRTCSEWYSTPSSAVRSWINSAIASSGLNSERKYATTCFDVIVLYTIYSEGGSSAKYLSGITSREPFLYRFFVRICCTFLLMEGFRAVW